MRAPPRHPEAVGASRSRAPPSGLGGAGWGVASREGRAATRSPLHHFADRCRDAEETRAFYEDLLGLPLVHAVKEELVPSTRERSPFVQLFFALKDGSSIAFFDLGDDVKAAPSPNTPAWVNHLALRVPSLDDVEIMKERLEANAVSVLGVTDHEPVKSIYVFDPNGIRPKFAAETATPEEL